MGIFLLIDEQILKELWPDTVHTAAYINSRCFKGRLGPLLFFVMIGRKLNPSYMRLFSSKCYAYVEKSISLILDKKRAHLLEMAV